MAKVRDLCISGEVLQLVHTVARLESKDQERILRIVSLLTLVPVTVQQRTQKMLKDLIDREPRSMFDCVASVDEVIEYLEDNTVSGGNYLTEPDGFHPPPIRN